MQPCSVAKAQYFGNQEQRQALPCARGGVVDTATPPPQTARSVRPRLLPFPYDNVATGFPSCTIRTAQDSARQRNRALGNLVQHPQARRFGILAFNRCHRSRQSPMTRLSRPLCLKIGNACTHRDAALVPTFLAVPQPTNRGLACCACCAGGSSRTGQPLHSDKPDKEDADRNERHPLPSFLLGRATYPAELRAGHFARSSSPAPLSQLYRGPTTKMLWLRLTATLASAG